MNEQRQHEAGFTLVEALVSMTLALFVLLGMATMYESNQSTYRQASDKVDLQQNARFALTEISRSIRMAGYFPENFNSGSNLVDGLHVGTESSAAFFGDMNDDGASEIQLFCLNNGEVRRITTATSTAGAYTCIGGETLAENVTALDFAFFDADGSAVPSGSATTFTLDGQGMGALPDMTSTLQRNSVRRVSVTITTATDAPPGKRAPTFTLGTVVDVRN